MDPQQPNPLWPAPDASQPWQPPQAANPWGPPQAANPWGPPQAANPWGPPAWQETPSPRHAAYANAAPSHGRRNAVIAGLVTAVLVIAEIVVAGSHASKAAARSTAFARQGQAFTPVYPTPSYPADPTPVGPIPADGVTSSTPVSATSGTSVYSDAFDDPGSGWPIEDATDASTIYANGHFSMTVTGHVNWLSLAPYQVPAQQVLLSMKATESGDPTGNAGFGLLCVRGPRSDGLLRYEFTINGNGRWSIERNEGTVSLTSPPSVLKQGTAPQAAGAVPTDISAVCATLADGTTTRLVLFVHGTQVADITDVAAPDAAGWLGGMISSGATGQTSTAQASAFSENQLGSPSQAGSNA